MKESRGSKRRESASFRRRSGRGRGRWKRRGGRWACMVTFRSIIRRSWSGGRRSIKRLWPRGTRLRLMQRGAKMRLKRFRNSLKRYRRLRRKNIWRRFRSSSRKVSGYERSLPKGSCRETKRPMIRRNEPGSETISFNSGGRKCSSKGSIFQVHRK